MVRVHPDLERIAERLTSAELRSVEDDDGDLLSRDHPNFVDVYSESGLRKAMQEYGIERDLAARGLGDHVYRITRDDPFRHRLEVLLRRATPNDPEVRIMDLRLHLQETRLPHPRRGEVEVGVVVVEWLSMQNPLAQFSDERPMLPGQRHPGTGMGRKVNDLLVLLCRRLGRDALVTVPERFHLALLYRMLGYVSVDAPAGPDDDDVLAVWAAAQRAGLSLGALAWAVERGCVLDVDGAPYVHTPHTVACPVSPRLERALRRSAPSRQIGVGIRIDLEAFWASVVKEPIPGLTPPDT